MKLIDGWRHHVTMGIGSETEHRAQSVTNFSGQILEGSLVKHTPCTVQSYSASMDCWEACERGDHERRANSGGAL